MKNIAIYTRKSIATDTGDSIGTQITLIKDYFKKQECRFEVFEDEGFSGGNTNRPSFKLMMNRIKEFDTVAVYKIDRIARNIVDFFNIFSQLEENGVQLISISEGFDPSTPGGKMMMTMLAGIAEMERMNIKQRVKDNMIQLAKQGKWSGGNVPVGYTTKRVVENGKECSYLEVNEDDKELVLDIYGLYESGFSTRKIAKEINLKYKLKTSQKRICNILYSPVYVGSSELINNYLKLNNYDVFGVPDGHGYLTYQKTKTTSNGYKVLDRENKTIAAVSKHEPIIPSDLWIKVQEKLKESTQAPKPRISQFTFLAHMVRCGYCGAPMNVYSDTRVTGDPQRFFRKTCNCDHAGKNYRGSRLTITKAEESLLTMLEDIDLNGIEKYICTKSLVINFDKEIENVNKKISKIDKLIIGLTDKIALASTNTMDIFLKRIEELVNDKKDLQEKILLLNRRKDKNNMSHSNQTILENNVNLFLENFNELTLSDKQFKIKQIIEYVTWKGIERKFDIKLLEL